MDVLQYLKEWADDVLPMVEAFNSNPTKGSCKWQPIRQELCIRLEIEKEYFVKRIS